MNIEYFVYLLFFMFYFLKHCKSEFIMTVATYCVVVAAVGADCLTK